MGVASYQRANDVIRNRIAENDRPVEFVMMEELNSLPKFEDAGRPFTDIWFVPGHGGWCAECPRTGYGYWYKTLREAVRRWRVTINGYDGIRWLATPNAELCGAAKRSPS